MAKVNGVNGKASGRLGNLIYSSWLGTEYVRINPGTRKEGNEKEKNTRNTFGADSWAIINPIKPLLKLTFREMARGDRGVFAARSYMIANAFDRDKKNKANFVPSKMLMSRGSLSLSNDIQVQLTPERELEFTWNPGIIGNMRGDDQVVLVAYNYDNMEVATSLAPANRRDGSATLDLNDLADGKVHVYLSFLSFDRNKASDSIYLGEVELTGISAQE